MPVKPIAASPHIDAQLLRRRQFGSHGQSEAVAKLRGLAPADVGERPRQAARRGELIRGLPASWVMMVLAISTVCMRSQMTR